MDSRHREAPSRYPGAHRDGSVGPAGADARPGTDASDERGAGPSLRLRLRLGLALAGGAAFGLAQLLAAAPDVVERVFATGWSPAVLRPLSRAAGLIPFPLAELVVAGFLLRQLAGAARGLAGVRRGERSLPHALGAGALRLGQDLGVAAVLFYALWGFNYARAPLEERLGLPDGTVAGDAEIAALAEAAVQRANEAYRALHGTADAGRPTGLPSDRGALRRALQQGWKEAARRLELPDHVAARYGPAKTFVGSGLLARLGISGFFFPFTGEPVLNGRVPAVAAVQALAHEQAHQRGAAPEDEAGFLGFVAASGAPHPLARYAAHAFASRYLLAELARRDRGRYQRLSARRLPGVRRDLADLRAYVERYRGPTSRLASRVNDAYLRSNRVEGGAESYGLVVRLLVAYGRARGPASGVTPEAGVRRADSPRP